MIYEGLKVLNLLDRVLKQTAKLRKAGTQALYKCPFCNHHKRKLEIAIAGEDFGYYNCWICGTSGKTLNTLFKKLNVQSQFYSELSKYTKVSNYKSFIHTIQNKDYVLPSEFISLLSPAKSLECINVMHYLKKRGITKQDIIRYNIGYCDSGIYRNRIVIPSYDKNGSLNYFCARIYDDSSKNPYMLPTWDKNIIGFELFINWDMPITIVEGAFDAISIRRNAIPLFGNTISDKLILTMIENDVKEVNILLDNDALRKAVIIYQILHRYNIKTKLIKLEDKDPSVLGFRKTTDIIKNSEITEFENLVSMKFDY